MRPILRKVLRGLIDQRRLASRPATRSEDGKIGQLERINKATDEILELFDAYQLPTLGNRYATWWNDQKTGLNEIANTVKSQ